MKKFFLIFFFLAALIGALNFVSAQEFNYQKARADYIFQSDTYKSALLDFNSKKDSYNKNQTLLLKEELRFSLLNFINTRNEFMKSYLNLLRTKTVESQGLNENEKQSIYTQIDKEVVWYESRENSYSPNNTLEEILNKSEEEDLRYKTETDTAIRFVLSFISYGELTSLKNKHLEIYRKLKTEADNLVSLKRADPNLFKRWFDDIEKELANIDDIREKAIEVINKIYDEDSWNRERLYQDSIEILGSGSNNLIKLNDFMKELEIVIKSIR